jgi:hypothetical protein
MTAVRRLVGMLLPPVLKSLALRLLRRKQLWSYRRLGQLPWSVGYSEAKRDLIEGHLLDESSIDLFRQGRPLPAAWGIGIDERCVEYPWVVSQLSDNPELVLDAGSALNHDYVLCSGIWSQKTLHVFTLAPESQCFWDRGISYAYGDLRKTPYRDELFSTIICISTLEHVGCDNSYYAGGANAHPGSASDYIKVMVELGRLLRPGGLLLLTVPFGVHQHFDSFQQFDSEMLAKAVSAFGPVRTVERTFFKYSASGWNMAEEAACRASEFALVPAHGRKELQATSEPPDDRAAAARSVACVAIRKG